MGCDTSMTFEIIIEFKRSRLCDEWMCNLSALWIISIFWRHGRYAIWAWIFLVNYKGIWWIINSIYVCLFCSLANTNVYYVTHYIDCKDDNVCQITIFMIRISSQLRTLLKKILNSYLTQQTKLVLWGQMKKANLLKEGLWGTSFMSLAPELEWVLKQLWLR